MTVLELEIISPPVIAQPLSEAGRYVSEDEYWARYYHDDDICYEWNDGFLEEKPVSDFGKSLMYLWFVKLLDQFLTSHPIASITALDLGFRLKLGRKKAIRRPDLGVIRHDNPVTMVHDDRTYRGVFDLCIESLSDSNQKEIERDVVDKKAEYESAGVQEYTILDNKARYTAFFQRTAQGIYLPIQPINGVIHSSVLPGFQFRIADLYRQPSLIELTKDNVYQGFVLLEYQAEKARAEAENKRADTEHAKAERLAAKLRELGISPDEI
jgi:Uma2 family endonuclease